ncbi:thiol reductase thioredoxin [Hydrogenovibrio sp. SC-1]|uniref:thioredoxin family protein n=1 Tax=Hydrogenovibrio sp. SC-1 TaxID=2065820 RepID=UPI000C79B9FF|nr:thioredoxin family protein [Hydrogenovibrio sp. SC-1]PLA74316.1 thiol reductase thioredoxin [Hydrogenovibrio sp. SC-1]
MAVIDLTIETFDSKITENEMVIIDFWAPWCGPCKTLMPLIDAAARKHPEIVFTKINIEEQPEVAEMLQVRSIPTLVFIREQMIIFAKVGTITAPELEQYIDKLKGLDMHKVHQDFAQAQIESEQRSTKP